MNLQEVNNLADDPASVSWPIKILVLLVLMGFILFMGYKLVIAGSIEQLAGYESREQELRGTFETKQRRASQLKVYEAQLEEMQHTFGTLVQQLPSDTEIPALILDISEKGVSNGLEIELFEPLKEEVKEFYAEKPIKLIAMGTYKELATFVSDISGLPRIVTIHNIGLTPEDDKDKGKGKLSVAPAAAVARGRRLRMEALIKTYRYLEGSDFSGQLAGKS
ncbi:MAG: type 4a pilus biogenesis protein PilO [Thiothrix sp.]|nr:type 4a pilus biogenesis protein PilO [Thiothrix sp.]HPQ95183.1 type 4a pilus biogenesis protein PilO [Thiolinea sp.]